MKLVVAFVMSLVACGGSGAGSGQATASPEAFALQFTGTYLGLGSLSYVELRPDGTFAAQLSGQAARGELTAGRGTQLPLLFHLAAPLACTAEVTAYDGLLHIGDQTLSLERPALSDEELCDRSAGHWTDDDPDPATGLYCVCPDGTAFIPAAGGCISKAAVER